MANPDPTDAEVIEAAIEADRLQLHTAMPARVVSYDRAKQTVEAQPVVLAAMICTDGSVETEQLPVCPNVPVAWPSGGGFSILWELEPDDEGFLVFSEAAMAQWRESGDISEPGDIRRHDLSYPVFFPLKSSTKAPLTAPTDGAALLGGGIFRVGGGAAGTAAKFVAIAERVLEELEAIKTYLDAHTHAGVTAGAGVTGPPSAPMPAPSEVAATLLKSE